LEGTKRRELAKDPAYIEKVLREGMEEARKAAAATMDRVRSAVRVITLTKGKTLTIESLFIHDVRGYSPSNSSIKKLHYSV